jgi:hypothetical protein
LVELGNPQKRHWAACPVRLTLAALSTLACPPRLTFRLAFVAMTMLAALLKTRLPLMKSRL